MRLYDQVGDRQALAPLLDASYADWNGGQVDRTRPADLLAIATAARLDDNWKDANQVLRDAARADPHDVTANLDWGLLLLAKHNAPDAEASFEKVLEVDPDNPDAHVGPGPRRGRRSLRRRHGARRSWRRALAVNPVHAGALALRAELALDGEQFDAARADVAALRRVNPATAAPFASTPPSPACWTTPPATPARARVTWRRGHATASSSRSSPRRWPGSGATTRRATWRPRGWRPTPTTPPACRRWRPACCAWATRPPACRRCARRGSATLTIGARTTCWTCTKRSSRRGYVTVSTAHLRLRVPREARAAVEEVVGPFLEARYRDDVTRYGFEPHGPVTFELFADPRQFAVRTTGLPTIGVSAVCFGRVITSESPTNHAFNWGMVLTHELAHVFAIELSRGRVPRWFTEGLSEVEAARVRPEWSRHDDASLYGAWRRGEIPSLADLSDSFLGARTGEQASRAYALAAEAVAFLERRLGFPGVRAALVAYGRGERGAAVLERAAGLPIAELDRAFRDDLAHRLQRFAGQYLPTEWLGRRRRPRLGGGSRDRRPGARRPEDRGVRR